MHRLSRHHISFKNAITGLVWVFYSQPNFQIHIFLSVVAVLLGVVLRITGLEMLIIIFTIILGLSVEMINTSIEAMTDLITIEWRKEAKIAKDVSAGMMLLVATGTLIIGIYIFLPKLIELFLIKG